MGRSGSEWFGVSRSVSEFVGVGRMMMMMMMMMMMILMISLFRVG